MAEVCPRIVFGGNGDAANMWLWFAVWSWIVEFCDDGFYSKANLDISNISRGVLRQEIPRYNGVGKTKSENVFKRHDALKIPRPFVS